MSTLRFNPRDVNLLYEHAKTIGSTSIALVHDDGVYLMVRGEPRLVNLDKSYGPAGKKQHPYWCAYAEGCDPAVNEDFWEAARDLVGGDDFAEELPIDMLEHSIRFGMEDPDKRTFVLKLTARSVSCTCFKQKPPAASKARKSIEGEVQKPVPATPGTMEW